MSATNGQVETTLPQAVKETDHKRFAVIYDEKAVSTRDFVYYFRVIDPVSINQQGNDNIERESIIRMK